MVDRKNISAPFLVLGLAFVAIGASGHRALIAIGLAFLAVALQRMVRR
jgi:hypothetical protein